MNKYNLEIITLLDTNYSYIIHNDKNAAVIDPGEAEPIISRLRSRNLNLSYILLTHNHYDHSGGVKELISLFPDAELIDHSSLKSELFNDKLPLTILKTPGHTEDSCCFYTPSLKCIFSGDTLFIGICGRIIDGSYQQMYDSLQSLKKIPGDTRILPGHEYLHYATRFIKNLDGTSSHYENLNSSLESNISSEIENNPFMTSDYNAFKKLRILKNSK